MSTYYLLTYYLLLTTDLHEALRVEQQVTRLHVSVHEVGRVHVHEGLEALVPVRVQARVQAGAQVRAQVRARGSGSGLGLGVRARVRARPGARVGREPLQRPKPAEPL